MIKVRIAFLAPIVLLASSCASQPDPPERVPSHQYLPQQLEMRYSPAAIFGGGTELIFKNGYLVRKEYEPAKTEYFVPTEEQWSDFWKEMKRLRIWEWRRRYHPSDIAETVFDGGGWHLLMAYQGRAVDTSGENAGPKPNSPEATAVVPDGWDRDLGNAISRLIGEEG